MKYLHRSFIINIAKSYVMNPHNSAQNLLMKANSNYNYYWHKRLPFL